MLRISISKTPRIITQEHGRQSLHSCFDVVEKLCKCAILHLWDPQSWIPSGSGLSEQKKKVWFDMSTAVLLIGSVLTLPQGMVWYFHLWFHLWYMLCSHHSPLLHVQEKIKTSHLHIRQETLCSTSQGTSKFSLYLVRIRENGAQPNSTFQDGILSYCPSPRL